MSKFAKGNNSKNNFILEMSYGNLLIIFYKLTKFEAAICYSYKNIFIISFQWPNLHKAMTRKK